MNSIQTLSHKGLVWKANQAALEPLLGAERSISTGYSALDQALLRSGWPDDCIVELMLEQAGVGEVSLWLPWLAETVKQSQKHIAFISPPFLPSVAAFMAYGIEPRHIWLLSPRTDKETLWLQQQCLLEGHCCAVFMWHGVKAKDTDLRKLQLAAKQGNTLGISIRPANAQALSSPAPYRLLLQRSSTQQSKLTLLKRRGGWACEPLYLTLKDKPTLTTDGASIQQISKTMG